MLVTESTMLVMTALRFLVRKTSAGHVWVQGSSVFLCIPAGENVLNSLLEELEQLTRKFHENSNLGSALRTRVSDEYGRQRNLLFSGSEGPEGIV